MIVLNKIDEVVDDYQQKTRKKPELAVVSVKVFDALKASGLLSKPSGPKYLENSFGAKILVHSFGSLKIPFPHTEDQTPKPRELYPDTEEPFVLCKTRLLGCSINPKKTVVYDLKGVI